MAVLIRNLSCSGLGNANAITWAMTLLPNCSTGDSVHQFRLESSDEVKVMWIVRLALRRPYTFVVLAILILVLGTLSALRTPTDIFPNINIPVVSIIWNFTGLAPSEMANRIVVLQERNLTTVVNNIEHIESQSLNGIGVIKVFFHPGADISTAIAQIAGQSQTQLKVMPLGTTPPLVITYSASSVPILHPPPPSPHLSSPHLNNYSP